jgi:hypothetical protein
MRDMQKELEKAIKSLEYEKSMLLLNEDNLVQTRKSLNYLGSAAKKKK